MSSVQRLQVMYESKQQEWSVAHDRLTSLRQARLIETDASNQFKLDRQIKVGEQELAVIQQELDNLEHQLTQTKQTSRKTDRSPGSNTLSHKAPLNQQSSVEKGFSQTTQNTNKHQVPKSSNSGSFFTRRSFIIFSLLVVSTWSGFAFWSGRKRDIYNRESAVGRYVQLVAEAQKSFYERNGRFASDLESLGLDLPLETSDYKYNIEINGARATIKAQALNNQLRSATGVTLIATLFGELSAFSGHCEADQPGAGPPGVPVLQGGTGGGSLECLPGSSNAWTKGYQ